MNFRLFSLLLMFTILTINNYFQIIYSIFSTLTIIRIPFSTADYQFMSVNK